MLVNRLWSFKPQNKRKVQQFLLVHSALAQFWFFHGKYHDYTFVARFPDKTRSLIDKIRHNSGNGAINAFKQRANFHGEFSFSNFTDEKFTKFWFCLLLDILQTLQWIDTKTCWYLNPIFLTNLSQAAELNNIFYVFITDGLTLSWRPGLLLIPSRALCWSWDL